MRTDKNSWGRPFALCLLPLAFCPLSPGLRATQPDSGVSGRGSAAIVQLLAVGPGTGGRKQECAATGFLVNEDGYILTNAHVVEDARRCLAASPGAKLVAKLGDARVAQAVSCDVVALDEIHDLALLKTERATAEPQAFLELIAEPVAEGTSVAVTGHTAFSWRAQTQLGKVLRRLKLALDEKSKEPSDVLLLDIPLARGASGSPAYLPSSGQVLGVVSRQNPGRRFDTVAIPIRYAIELLDGHGIRWHRAR